MTTRREFLGRGFGILAGAAVLGSATAVPVLANYRNEDKPAARTRDMARDGSCDAIPDGHPQNRGETNARKEGAPVRGGNRSGVGAMTSGRHGPRDSAHPGTPRGAGDGTCDGSGPDQ